MRRLLVLLPLFLSACVTNEYFRPHVSWSDSRSFGSMCETNKQVHMKLREGVIMELEVAVSSSSVRIFDLDWRFRLEKGNTVQLVSNMVLATNPADGAEHELKVRRITFRPYGSDEYVVLGALGLMKGEGKNDHAELSWGEYSPWYGHGDVFNLSINSFSPSPQEVVVQLPDLLINGEPTSLDAIKFSKTTGTSVCM